MKIGVLTPDRGDRPLFLQLCMAMVDRQTWSPHSHCIENYDAISDAPDLGARLRSGLENLFVHSGADVVAVMENDDYYSADYLAALVNGWSFADEPDVFGFGETWYYHIGKRRFIHMSHPNRASLCGTLLTRGVLDLKWADNEIFVDSIIWSQMSGKTMPLSVSDPEFIGIKHGVGKCGGCGHHSLEYPHQDPRGEWLRRRVDPFAWQFYETFAK